MLVALVWQIMLFFFTIPLRIYNRSIKRNEVYNKGEAIKIALINAAFIFVLNFLLFVVITKELSFIIIPIMFSLLGLGTGYKYLIEYKQAEK